MIDQDINPYETPRATTTPAEFTRLAKRDAFGRRCIQAAVIYMAIYFPSAVIFVILAPREMEAAVVPFHVAGIILNFSALVATLRDLYHRPFSKARHKWLWLLAILYTGCIGWLVYVFKYALTPLPRKSQDETVGGSS